MVSQLSWPVLASCWFPKIIYKLKGTDIPLQHTREPFCSNGLSFKAYKQELESTLFSCLGPGSWTQARPCHLLKAPYVSSVLVGFKGRNPSLDIYIYICIYVCLSGHSSGAIDRQALDVTLLPKPKPVTRQDDLEGSRSGAGGIQIGL